MYFPSHVITYMNVLSNHQVVQISRHPTPYEDRLQSLKLWSLEERRNRQDLIEVFKTRIRLQELFMLEENTKGTRGHSLKLAKMRCTRDCWRHFFSNRVINWWNRLDQQTVGASSLNVFKTRLSMIRNTRMGFFMD